MKKLALVFALLLIAAFYVTPVMASEFSAGGHYRFEAVDSDPGANGESRTYFDQRFRLAFNWAVNDSVSAQLRGDFAEFMWGDGYRPEQGTDTLMIDQAWVKIKQGPMTLKIGQQGGDWGLGTLWSDQFQGIQADFAFSPVTLKLLYVKESEGGLTGNVLTDDGINDDVDTYGVGLVFANDTFSGGISYVYQDIATNDTDADGISVYAIVPIGMLTVSGEVTTFGGDAGGGNDFDGTEVHIDLSADISETFNAGVTALWADDVEGNDTQITAISDDSVFKPFDFDGALAYNNGYFGGATGIFDVAGTGSGVKGIVGHVKFAATEAITIYARLGYVEPNDTDKTNLDSQLIALGSIDYAWMPAVTLSGGIGYVAPSYDDNTDDDPSLLTTVQLGVSF